ncbi:MAG: hypothetical protein ACJA1A_003690 [Saprospiraceae bacterium]|jgi:hypothetical protein|tara:strand:- start:4251 stop:6335 length:2085 start_codon:yes stop_codon:yes gene_type:complete
MDSIHFRAIESSEIVNLASITDIQSDQEGNLWFASEEGLFRYNGYELIKYTVDPSDDFSLLKDEVRNIYIDSKSKVWVAAPYSIYTYDSFRDRFNKMTENFRKKKQPIYNVVFFDVHELDEKHMIFATKTGLRIYEKESGEMVEYDSLVNKVEIDPYSTNAHVLHIESDTEDDNLLWLFTRDGLYRYQKRERKAKKIDGCDSIPFEDSRDRGNSMAVTKDMVYVVLNYLEMYAYHKRDKHWTHINKKFLREKKHHIRNIMPYKEGIIIVYIHKKLHYYSPLLGFQELPINYSKELTDHSYSNVGVDHNGHLSYINDNKLLVKSQEALFGENGIERLFVRHLQVEDQSIVDTFLSTDILMLEPHQRHIQFELGLKARKYDTPERYFYKVNNEEQWNLTVEGKVTLGDLSYGNHEIFGKVEFGGNVLEGTVKRFYIKPHFHETTWFKSLLFLCIMGILSFFYILINGRKKDQKNFEQQLLNLEMNALRSQMNPHFLFNSLNSIKNYVVSKSKDEAADYLTKFSILMRMILENSRKKFLYLSEEIEMLSLYVEMEQRRLNYSFDYVVDIDDKVDMSFFVAPLLLQPYVENAIWHGLMNKEGYRKLSFKVEPKDTGILCIIRDNGVGRDQAEMLKKGNVSTKKSLGLKITNDRFKRINQMYDIKADVQTIDLFDNDGHATGTEVRIYLPQIINPKIYD